MTTTSSHVFVQGGVRSSLELKNKALALLVANPIRAEDDGSKEAQIVNSCYTGSLLFAQAALPWKCLCKSAILHAHQTFEDTSLNSGYRYLHKVNANSLGIVQVKKPTDMSYLDDYVCNNSFDIVSNTDPIFARWTEQTGDITIFSPMLVQACALQIAINAIELARSIERKADFEKQYQLCLEQAKVNEVEQTSLGMLAKDRRETEAKLDAHRWHDTSAVDKAMSDYKRASINFVADLMAFRAKLATGYRPTREESERFADYIGS